MANIVVFAAHNDDHALGMGGTIAKHYAQGDAVTTFIGSFGELSHPHLKPEVISKQRVKEAQRADRAFGGDGHVIFLGLKEFKFERDFHRKGFARTLAKRIRGLRPDKIYVPAPDDTHPDHKAIGALIHDLIEDNRLRCDVYAYYVYPNLAPLRAPKLTVDVSDTYRKKLEALKAFRSQINPFSYLITNNLVFLYALFRNGLAGFLHGVRFAETFAKIH